MKEANFFDDMKEVDFLDEDWVVDEKRMGRWPTMNMLQMRTLHLLYWESGCSGSCDQ